MFGPASGMNIEQVINESEPRDGILTDLCVPLGAWTLAAGTVLVATGAGIVGMGASMTSALGMVFNATADTGDIATLCWCTPRDFRECGATVKNPGSSNYSDLQLQVLARKLDTTGSAAENATLALTGDAYWLYSNPNTATDPADTALNHLTSPAAATLDAKYGAASEEGFKWYTLDIAARLLAETKVIKANSYLQFNLSVSAAVGTALAVEVIGTRICYRRHAAFAERAARTRKTLMGSLATGLAGTAGAAVYN